MADDRLARSGSATDAAAILLLVCALLAIGLSHDLAAKVALLAAGLAWLAGRWHWRTAVLAVGTAAVLAALLSPLAAERLPSPQVTADWTWLPASSHHRLTIWSFTARNIADKPLFGWGFDGARAIPGGKTIIPVVRLKGCAQTAPPVVVPGRDQPVAGDCVLWEESLPLHPHNAWLQIWLELGGIGAVLAAWLVWGLTERLGGQAAAPPDRAAAIATLVAALVVCSVSYGFWQSWWQSTLWIAAAVTAPLLRSGPILPADDDRRGNPG